METLNVVLTAGLGVLVIFVLLKLITAPIRLIFKLLLNTLIGFALLYLANLIGGVFGFSLEFTAVNALIAGIFGIPGVIALILFQFL